MYMCGRDMLVESFICICCRSLSIVVVFVLSKHVECFPYIPKFCLNFVFRSINVGHATDRLPSIVPTECFVWKWVYTRERALSCAFSDAVTKKRITNECSRANQWFEVVNTKNFLMFLFFVSFRFRFLSSSVQSILSSILSLFVIQKCLPLFCQLSHLFLANRRQNALWVTILLQKKTRRSIELKRIAFERNWISCCFEWDYDV